MLLVAALAPLVVLATTVVADPNAIPNSPISISLPITKQINLTGTFHPSQRDQNRWMNLLTGGQASTSEITEVPLTYSIIAYSANIGVGDPPTYYSLTVDTGSANTWVGANKPYSKTKTSVKTDDFLNVPYGTASVNGTEYEETVTIAPGVAIRQSIGVASNSFGIYPFDGILGIGPKYLTLDTLFPDNTSIIPTVTDNLYGQGKIEQNLVAVSFEPTASEPVIDGELTFGSTDSTKYTGDITYFPITKTLPSGRFWGVDASFIYGNAQGKKAPVTILDTTAGVIDTGTNQIGLGTDAYNRYVDATGAVYDENTGLLRITPAQYENLQSLFFGIGGRTYELNANAQIWPRTLGVPGGEKDSIYLVVFDLGSIISLDLGFIAGQPFLERYYSVFDTGNSRVGFATTPFTYADIN
ncbi:family A1 protease [Russula ochroleuca]|uniref:Family A1 protease n=1 Tax=Russula ochroleuca TaxID=152965 RepID=A0A9P5JXY8_9AGAM|nr:family A1 protease [Russula ochroleuca]